MLVGVKQKMPNIGQKSRIMINNEAILQGDIYEYLENTP